MNLASQTPQNQPENAGDESTPQEQSCISQAVKKRFRPTRREWYCVTTLGILGLCTAFFWRPIQRQVLTGFVLRAETVAIEPAKEVVDRSRDPAALLNRLWHTQKTPHRQFVLSYLGRTVESKPDLFHAMEPVLLEATWDVDVEARELAFAALARKKHSELRRLALEQLEDLDPAVRLIGLRSLRTIATSNDVPRAMQLLGDPEPRVVVAAALVLRQATGRDFGVKSSHARPTFTSIDNNPPPAPDVKAISQGVQRWQAWWNDHRADYPVPLPLPQPRHPMQLTTPDFELEDSNGKSVRLSAYRGRVVLLTFWGLDAPASLEDVQSLSALYRPDSESVAIMGICVPATPSCADEHKHEHGHPHNNAGSSDPSPKPLPMQVQVQKATLERKISHPMLLDSKGTIGSRFDVEELPTHVLIDAQGLVRRRFTGTRTKPVLEALIEELVDMNTTRAQ